MIRWGMCFKKCGMQLRSSINLIHFNLLKYVSNNTFRRLIDNRMAQLLKRITTLNVRIDMQVSFYKGLQQMYFSLVCIFISFFNVSQALWKTASFSCLLPCLISCNMLFSVKYMKKIGLHVVMFLERRVVF